MTEIALLSFDGLDPRVIYDNLDELPNIDSVTEDSMHGSWATPGHTIPSFISTLTGESYNVFDFHWDSGDGGFQRHRQTEMEFMWDVTDSSLSLLNVPVVYPPEDIDDCMVAGFLAPDSVVETNLAKPQELQEYLNSIDYIHDVHADNTYDEMGAEGMVEHMKRIMDKRTEAAKHILDKYDSDLFYSVWSSPDRWFHQCQKHGEDHFPLYKKADEVVGEMLEYLPDEIPVIIFSDHGFAHFPGDDAVHKGHMYNGWYCIDSDKIPGYRDDSLNILDLYPTVLNYLDGEVSPDLDGRILFHQEKQSKDVEDRLDNLGYLE